jgi:hypothetical protein
VKITSADIRGLPLSELAAMMGMTHNNPGHILAIDPGCEQSAYVIYDVPERRVARHAARRRRVPSGGRPLRA